MGDPTRDDGDIDALMRDLIRSGRVSDETARVWNWVFDLELPKNYEVAPRRYGRADHLSTADVRRIVDRCEKNSGAPAPQDPRLVQLATRLCGEYMDRAAERPPAEVSDADATALAALGIRWD